MNFRRLKHYSVAALCAWITIAIFAAIGWCWNIAKIVQEPFVWPPSGKVAVRLIGIPIVPVGAVMGYIP